jgi:hypothetical protein
VGGVGSGSFRASRLAAVRAVALDLVVPALIVPALIVLVVIAPGVFVLGVIGSTGSAAATVPRHTTSRYERTASRRRLEAQGVAAGRAGAQGIVILDFGRPAVLHGRSGTIAVGGPFLSLRAIEDGIEAYVRGYFDAAPAYTALHVALGTNDSCGTGQPCGRAVCGCTDEPPSFAAWGAALAYTVESLDAWVAGLRAENSYTDDVEVVAADDAEPAFDPGFQNTYDLLAGYAGAVGGSTPAMVDYGSAEPDFWSEGQLFQVAYGFAPDVPMPEIYYPSEALEWSSLLLYAKVVLGRSVAIQGVLAQGHGTNTPAQAYHDMLSAVSGITGQQVIPWLSQIVH